MTEYYELNNHKVSPKTSMTYEATRLCIHVLRKTSPRTVNDPTKLIPRAEVFILLDIYTLRHHPKKK